MFLLRWRSQADDEVLEIFQVAFSDQGPLSLRTSRSRNILVTVPKPALLQDKAGLPDALN